MDAGGGDGLGAGPLTHGDKLGGGVAHPRAVGESAEGGRDDGEGGGDDDHHEDEFEEGEGAAVPRCLKTDEQLGMDCCVTHLRLGYLLSSQLVTSSLPSRPSAPRE